MTRYAILTAAIAVVLALPTAVAPSANAQSAPAINRTITMIAVEPKGGTTVDKEPFPAAALPPGGGYVLKAPDPTGRWEVSAYRWDPNQLIVNEGDDVTLEILGVNGASHPTVIQGYDLRFNVKRGEVTRVSFKADKPGVFKIDCMVHRPSMVGEIIVLPRQQ